MSESLPFLQQVRNSANITLDVLLTGFDANITLAHNAANSANVTAQTGISIAELAYGEANVALPEAGGVMTGSIHFDGPARLIRDTANAGYMDGGYAGAETPTTIGLIYTIGGTSYLPRSNNLGLVYGVGYTNSAYASNTVPLSFTSNPVGHWGFYVAEAGQTEIFLDSQNGTGYFRGDVVVGPGHDFYIDTIPITSLISNAYNEANAAYAQATAAFNQANTALTVAEDAYAEANGSQSVVAQSLATNGYIHWSGGFIEQWGEYTGGGGSPQAVTFPLAFPTACFNVVMTPIGSTESYDISSTSKTGFVVNVGASGVNFYWRAVGH